VEWTGNDLYVGWSPLGPVGGQYDPSRIPGGPYIYAPVQQLAATDLSARLLKQTEVGVAAAQMQPIVNVAERRGVRVNLGPDIRRVERAAGMTLTRVKVEDVLPHGPGSAAGEPATGASTPASPADELHRLGGDVARDAGDARTRFGQAPASLAAVRAILLPPPAKEGDDASRTAPVRHPGPRPAHRSTGVKGAARDTIR
jgi:hypothetical protein